MSSSVDSLIDYLKVQEAKGVHNIYLDDEAKELLRSLLRDSRKRPSARQVAEKGGAEAAKIATAPAGKLIIPKEGSPDERLASLSQQTIAWRAAQEPGTLRTKMVFSSGNPEADLMLVNAAPSYHDERIGAPLSGKVGKKLGEILRAMGLTKPDTYLSNIVKFRPAMPQQTTNSRKPTSAELAAWLPFLREEVRIVKPKCIVALGQDAATGMLALSGSPKIDTLRDQWHEFEGIPLRISYHPAYLLQNDDNSRDKRKIWEDMLAVMEQLELPISEKQRGYFLAK